ncbi:protein ILRUN-like [Bolinopsis microptera]|uniref:protein ILRUN-like n=1 Tax=Bolinopsis microptera TaxID=2820187 RepID=UPI003079E2E5
MTGWDIQEALSSYTEVNREGNKLLAMSFVKDMTFGEGESVPPNSTFTKVWRIRNSGRETWPSGCTLRCTDGHRFNPHTEVSLDPIFPGFESDVRVVLCSPQLSGTYQSKWRMCSPTGIFFGDPIWMIIKVESCGVLGIAQHSNLLAFGSTSEFSPMNPFSMR